MDIFEEFDFHPMKIHAAWLTMVYALMLICMAVDLVCGIRKARKAGKATTSQGYKRTCDKGVKYFMPMLCLTCVDIMVSTFEPMPFLTMAIAAFNMWCEFKSIFENTHQKEEIRKAEKTMSIVLENKDELAQAMAKLLKEFLTDKNDKT